MGNATLRIRARSTRFGMAVFMMSNCAAYAQERPEALPGERGLQDIIVTAQRQETRLQDTPIAVTAFGAEALKERGVTSLIDLSTFTPNLSIGTRSATGILAGSISIRGMGIDSQAASAAVGVYVDDVYLPAAAGNLLGTFDVERIEVLRGPQGTLFGRNTIAGAVQYVSVKPGEDFDGYVDGMFGEQGRREISGALNIPLADTLAVRLSGAYKEQGGYVRDQINDVKRGALETKQARLQLRWQPTERLTLDLKGEYLDQETNGRALTVTAVEPNSALVLAAQFLTLPAELRAILAETRPLDASYLSAGRYTAPGFNALDRSRFEYQAVQGTIAYDLTDKIMLKSITAYSDSRATALLDLDATPLAITSVDNGLTRDTLFSQEVQLAGTFLGDRLHLTTGLYLYEGETSVSGQSLVLGRAPGVDVTGANRRKISSIAGYAHATYDLTGTISATLGLRYSREKSEGQLLAGPVVRAEFTDWSPHLGLNLKPAENMLFYVKASKGFRAGGFYFSQVLPAGSAPFGPETAWTYEAGARLELFDRRLRLNPTIFRTDWKNIQFNRIVFLGIDPVQTVANAGDARIHGFELETQLSVTDRLTFTGTAAALRGKYRRILAGIGITTDSELQRAPDWQVSIGGRYALPLASGAQVIASSNYAWTDTQRSAVSDLEAVRLPSFGLVNARLEYRARDNRWSLAAYANNLTDTYYLIGGVDAARLQTWGTRNDDPGRPREIGVNLRFNF